MTTKQTEALKLALEALKDYKRNDDRVSIAMGILQDALAEQPAPSSHLTDEQKAANGLAWLARLEAMREEFAGLAEQPAPVAEPHKQQYPTLTYGEVERTMQSLRNGTLEHQQAYEVMKDKPLYTSPPYEAAPLANANAGQRSVKPWVGLNDDDLDGYTKSNVLMVRHFERVLFERNTQPCLEGLPEPIRTPPEKGTEYWTIGLGRWTWGGTTHDYSSLGNGIWRCETDVWEVHAAIRRALGIESNIAAVFQNRHEAKLREKNT